MIISHRYKYVFIQLPFTGSTAISKELCENYNGSRILSKHSTYFDFLKIANPEERRYFIFSCIRNPLDSVVSSYFKYKTDHKQRFTDPIKLKKKRGIVGYLDNRIFHYLKKTDSDFSTYFLKFYKVPYNSWASLSHEKSTFIIRFENLQEDFAKAIQLIGVEQKRPLPLINRTGMKERDFLSYYNPKAIKRAKRVFGPFMKRWGYEFPRQWGDILVPWWNQAEYEFFDIFRNFYWKHLRTRI
jgi:hypothetical protein